MAPFLPGRHDRAGNPQFTLGVHRATPGGNRRTRGAGLDVFPLSLLHICGTLSRSAGPPVRAK